MASDENRRPADTLVDFGITGDLARKMTLRALYRLERRGRLDCRIIGVAAQDWTVAQLIEHARTSISESGEKVDDAVFERFAKRLSYISGDVTDDALYTRLAEELGSDARAVYYLQMPPSLFGPIVEKLGAHDLLHGARVAVEKPFGHDLASARDLNERLRAVLDEEQLLRVDHFLGKAPIIEVEYLRFANLALAELWDRHSVSAIQITMAENFGVEDRGAFYDPVGALRDVVQNHLLQVLALVTMEPPVGPDADDLRDKTGELLKSVCQRRSEALRARPVRGLPRRAGRAEGLGHRDVRGAAAGDRKLALVRRPDLPAGRQGPGRTRHRGAAASAPLAAARVPAQGAPGRAEPDRAARRPGAWAAAGLTAKDDDGGWVPLTLDSSFARELGEPLEPYERLLHGALIGDAQLFAREDSVEESWRIVQPLIDAAPPVHTYQRGSWGPAEQADKLVRGHAHWHKPWTPDEV